MKRFDFPIGTRLIVKDHQDDIARLPCGPVFTVVRANFLAHAENDNDESVVVKDAAGVETQAFVTCFRWAP
jgi:hypothetical protein